MRDPSAFGGLIVLLAACAPERSYLSLPSLEGVEAIAFLSSDRNEVSFAPYPDVGVIALEIESDADDGRLFLLGFPCGVGRLQRDAEPVRRPAELYSSAYGSVETLAWQKETSVPEWVGARLPWPLQTGRPCRSFSRRVFQLDPPTEITSTAALDSSRVLLSAEGGLFLFDGVESSSVTAVSIGESARAFVGLDGEVWLVDGTGRLAAGHPDRGFQLLPPERWLPIEGNSIALGSAAADELFALVAHGEAENSVVSTFWYHDAAWQTLIDAQPSPIDGPGIALLVLGPGRALLSTGDRAGVTLAQDGRLIRETFPLPSRPRVFARHPELGPIAGMQTGAFLSRGDSGWVVLRAPLPTLVNESIRALGPLGHGIAYTEVDDNFQQWFPDDESCEVRNLQREGGDSFHNMVSLGDTFVLAPGVGPTAARRGGEFHVLEPMPLPDACTVDDGLRGQPW